MNLVTALDFNIPPYSIPNLDKVVNTFNLFVTEQQNDILLYVLGSDLFNAFNDGLDALPDEWAVGTSFLLGAETVYGNDMWTAVQNNTGVIPVEGADWTLSQPNNRWLLLKNGNTYTYNERVYRFKGISKMLRPYIYSQWLEATFKQMVGVGGITMPKTENSLVVSPSEDIIKSWNAFAREIGDNYNQQGTLYGYLVNTNLADGTFDDTFDLTFTSFEAYLDYWFVSPGLKNFLDL